MKKLIILVVLFAFACTYSWAQLDGSPVDIPDDGRLFLVAARTTYTDKNDSSAPFKHESTPDGTSLIFKFEDGKWFHVQMFGVKTAKVFPLSTYSVVSIKGNQAVVRPTQYSCCDSCYEILSFLHNDANDLLFMKREFPNSEYVEVYSGIWVMPDDEAFKIIESGGIKEFDTNTPSADEDEALTPIHTCEPYSLNCGIGNEFRLTSGLAGSHWEPSARMIYDGRDHILSIMKPASDTYYTIYEGDNAYVRFSNGEIMELQITDKFGIWNYYQKGYWVSNVHMPPRYITQMFYIIPDPDKFIKNEISKLRYFVNHQAKDIDFMQEGNIKKVNRSLTESFTKAREDYHQNRILDQDPLTGF